MPELSSLRHEGYPLPMELSESAQRVRDFLARQPGGEASWDQIYWRLGGGTAELVQAKRELLAAELIEIQPSQHLGESAVYRLLRTDAPAGPRGRLSALAS